MSDIPILELLSPAKNKEVALQALNAGADAVYIGGPAFGAREAAGNAWSDIEAVAAYSHRYGAKTYLTLNTILFEDELEAARKAALTAYEAGVDALIVQDMAFLKMDLPPIELHASTQCDIRTPEKVRFLADVGFSQVVLARELTLEQIRSCRAAAPNATLEFFVHGALCVCYSGQCYLSAATRGRSANRGACAQLCRLPYTVKDYKGDVIKSHCFALSLKDNDQCGNIRELIEAGVRSFKIEGRLKDASYVKNITAYYRKALDCLIEENICQSASLGKTTFSFTPNPEKTFHRGSCEAFVHGRPERLAQMHTPKSTGEAIGTVAKKDFVRRALLIDPKKGIDLHNGDGLAYFTQKGDFTGLRVNRTEAAGRLIRIYPFEAIGKISDLTTGAPLFRNADRVFLKTLEGPCIERHIAVSASLNISSTTLTLTLRTGPYTVSVTEGAALDAAKDPSRTPEAVKKALSKTGDTVFAVSDLILTGNKDLFIPASLLNALRRRACEALQETISKRRPRTPPERKKADATGFSSDYRANVANSLARDFWLEHGLTITEKAFELTGENTHERELMRCRYCLRHDLGLCPKSVKGSKEKKEAFKKGNAGHLKPESLELLDPKGFTYIASFDCRHCEMVLTQSRRKALSLRDKI